VVCLQDEAHVGFMSMIDSIMESAQAHLERLNRRRRETVPASALVVGVQCGGSDAFSGVTANPAVGFCTDLLVRAGATVMFSEVTEVRDGIDQLTSRAATPEVAQAMIAEMPGGPQRQHHARQQEGRAVEHRRKGHGLHRQERHRAHHGRAVAGAAAGGPWHRARAGVRGHARQRLHLRHAAAGRRHEPARLHHRARHALRAGCGAGDQGRIADGGASIEDVGWELFRLMLDVASGRRKTWAEHWKLHNQLVLFNPAPVT
jgi:galactarate dehydratase